MIFIALFYVMAEFLVQQGMANTVIGLGAIELLCELTFAFFYWLSK